MCSPQDTGGYHTLALPVRALRDASSTPGKKIAEVNYNKKENSSLPSRKFASEKLSVGWTRFLKSDGHAVNLPSGGGSIILLAVIITGGDAPLAGRVPKLRCTASVAAATDSSSPCLTELILAPLTQAQKAQVSQRQNMPPPPSI